MVDFIQQLISVDQKLFLALNGSRSLFWDSVMTIITSTYVWIPIFVVLLYVIVRNNSAKVVIWLLISIGINILICDQISSGICKPFFMRYRPTQDPTMMYLVDIVNGYRGGRYGFISSHAANTFGIWVFLSLLFRKFKISLGLFVWAILSSYSRIYLGVHYLGDILCGIIVGVISGCLIFGLYKYVLRRIMNQKNYLISSLYTSSGYLNTDMDILLVSLLLTYVFIPIIGIIQICL